MAFPWRRSHISKPPCPGLGHTHAIGEVVASGARTKPSTAGSGQVAECVVLPVEVAAILRVAVLAQVAGRRARRSGVQVAGSSSPSWAQVARYG